MPSFLYTLISEQPLFTGLFFLTSLLLSYAVSSVRSVFRSGLRELPGPRLASFSRLWNVANVWDGNAPTNFRRLHEKYGKIVRVGPNHVAISDVKVIPELYGFQDTYLKASYENICGAVRGPLTISQVNVL